MQHTAVLVGLFGAACALPTKPLAMPESGFVESIRCVGGTYGLALPSDARRLKTLGTVIREEIGEVEKWDGYTASRKTILFSGLSLGVVEFSNDAARLMVTHAELTSSKWNWISPFKLGRPVSEASALLAAAAKNDQKLKRSYGSDSDNIQIHSVGGLVTRVSYSCYSG